MMRGRFTCRRNSVSACLPPSESDTDAGVTTSAQSRPSVSTTRWRFRPTAFFPPIVASRPALFGRLYGLAVEDGRGWFRRLAGLLSHPLPQRCVQRLPGTVLLPEAKIVKHNP